MSEKLTRDRVADYVRGQDVSGLCALIEADREAVRAETREELLKDHFKIGEQVIVGANTKSFVATLPMMGSNWQVQSVRRPAKKRPLAREEKVKKLKEHFANQHAWLPDELKNETLDDLCQAFEIPTEVEE